MNFNDANRMAEDMLGRLSPACEEGRAVIAGSLRRKRHDVHDIELVVNPLAGRPRPTFGEMAVHETKLDKLLYEMEQDRRIAKIKGGDRYKQYRLNTSRYGIATLNAFKFEVYINLPPSQWGVQLVIRTGPAKKQDNFSRWCVTNQAFGGGLPDGYKVKHLGVYHADQLDVKGEPLHGESPLAMPEEGDFFAFLGMDWIEPSQRHAPRR